MTKAEYEATRPEGEQKIEFPNHVVRAYVDEKGVLHVLTHHKSADGYEQLPLGYILGSSAIMMHPRLK